jgi:hypothetical protein
MPRSLEEIAQAIKSGEITEFVSLQEANILANDFGINLGSARDKRAAFRRMKKAIEAGEYKVREPETRSIEEVIADTAPELNSLFRDVMGKGGAKDPVVELRDEWVKAGPPPLGVSLSRWWDARLVELNKAIKASGRE